MSFPPKKLFLFQTTTDVVIDVGHPLIVLATIVATSTKRTDSQKGESKDKSGSDEKVPTTRETICTKGFVIQRKNVKKQNFFRLPPNNDQNGRG